MTEPVTHGTTSRKIAPRSATETPSLDATDRELLAPLQANARGERDDAGKKLGIARTTVIARMERLQKGGVITGYSVRPQSGRRWRSRCRYVGLSVAPRAGRDVLKRLAKMPEIKLVCSVSGEFDYVAWIRAESPNALDRLLDEIGETEGREQDHHVGGAGGTDQSGGGGPRFGRWLANHERFDVKCGSTHPSERCRCTTKQGYRLNPLPRSPHQTSARASGRTTAAAGRRP